MRREFLDHLPPVDCFDGLEDLQARLDLWLQSRNFDTVIDGYPNLGCPPVSLIYQSAFRSDGLI